MSRTNADGVDRVGLCRNCVHVRRIESVRGAEFWLCGRAATEPVRFVKYPALPVRWCAGYEPSASDSVSPK